MWPATLIFQSLGKVAHHLAACTENRHAVAERLRKQKAEMEKAESGKQKAEMKTGETEILNHGFHGWRGWEKDEL